MLKTTIIPVNGFGCWWTVSPFTGSLMRHANKPLVQDKIGRSVQNALDLCDNPFLVRPNIFNSATDRSKAFEATINSMVTRSYFVQRLPFFIRLMYCASSHILTSDSVLAMDAINSINSNLRFGHCLQKTLLVAKISEKFQENGVLLIGCNLPTAEMHAWIIEGNTQPDSLDRIWINYRPLLAISRAS